MTRQPEGTSMTLPASTAGVSAAAPLAEARAADPMVSMIERVVMDPNLPMERITAMIDIRERQMAKEAEQAFNAAFASAMSQMPDVPKNGRNNHTSNRYSTLDDLIRTARPVLAAHGLSLNWEIGEEGDRIRVTAIVRHALGHSIRTGQSGPRDSGRQMNALQGGGSTQTYMKRYTGFAILGLSSGDEADDDGQSAGVKGITEDQLQALQELVAKAEADEAKLCTFYRINALADLPADQLAAARSMLNKKIQSREPAQ